MRPAHDALYDDSFDCPPRPEDQEGHRVEPSGHFRFVHEHGSTFLQKPKGRPAELRATS